MDAVGEFQGILDHLMKPKGNRAQRRKNVKGTPIRKSASSRKVSR